jgi:hypothetical protein
MELLNKFLKKSTYTKGEALLDLLINKEVINMSYGMLTKRWMWRSKKKVFCFIKLLIEDEIIKMSSENKKILTIKIKGPREGNSSQKDPEIKRIIYREYKHLILYQDEYNELLRDYNKEDIEDIILKIENSQNNSKYRSFFKTAHCWLKSNKAKGLLLSQIGAKKSESKNKIGGKIVYTIIDIGTFNELIQKHGKDKIIELTPGLKQAFDTRGSLSKVIKEDNLYNEVYMVGKKNYLIKK